MKMKTCPECNGTGHMRGMPPYLEMTRDGNAIVIETPCYICEGTGTIPAEDVSHCAACGEPIELGLNWCGDHVPAADLWEALNAEKFIDAMLERVENG